MELTYYIFLQLLFTFLPLLCNLPFVVYLLSPPLSGSRYSLVLLCLLSITSLLSTAYSAHFIPIPKSSSERMKSTSMQSMMVENGPAERYLPYLNGAICLLLFFAAWAQKGATNVTNQSNHFWIWCLVPGGMHASLTATAAVLVWLTGLLVIFTFYHLGRRAMLDVDIGELERLKYDYKGA